MSCGVRVFLAELSSGSFVCNMANFYALAAPQNAISFGKHCNLHSDPQQKIATMQCARLLPICLCMCCLSAAIQLRKQGGTKGAQMQDILHVAQLAHGAAEIYSKEARSISATQAEGDVHLANALSRAALDQEVKKDKAPT